MEWLYRKLFLGKGYEFAEWILWFIIGTTQGSYGKRAEKTGDLLKGANVLINRILGSQEGLSSKKLIKIS